MEQMPQTMRALVASKYCRPDGYEIAQVLLPELTEPNQVLIRMHAAAMQAGDCQFASGRARMLLSIRSVSTLSTDSYLCACNKHDVRAAPLIPPTGLIGSP